MLELELELGLGAFEAGCGNRFGIGNSPLIPFFKLEKRNARLV